MTDNPSSSYIPKHSGCAKSSDLHTPGLDSPAPAPPAPAPPRRRKSSVASQNSLSALVNQQLRKEHEKAQTAREEFETLLKGANRKVNLGKDRHVAGVKEEKEKEEEERKVEGKVKGKAEEKG